MQAPTVFKSNSTGWRRNGRNMHAERSNSSFSKSDKNYDFWRKYGLFGLLALFLDDVSMTSSGGVGYVRVTWRPVSGPRGLVRWQTEWSNVRLSADAGPTWHDVGVMWAGGKQKW